MEIHNIPKIYFGSGISGNLYDLIKGIGKKALIVTMKELLDIGLLKPMLQNLKKNDFSYNIFDQVQPEPKTEDFYSAIELVKKEKYDLIIGFGGGSCIDYAKALSICATHKKNVWEYVNLSNKPPELINAKKLIPIIAIPTTSGTGSEVTPFSVVINNESLQEGTIKDSSIIPNIAVIDPGLMKKLPQSWTAITGIDAFSHALESFFNKANRSPFSDMVSIEAMKNIYHYLPRAYKDGEDAEAREKVAYGAMLAGIAISNAGTTVGHALVHPTDARVGSPHGISVGFYLLPVLRHTLPHEWDRFADIVNIFQNTSHLNKKDLAWKGYDLVENFVSQFKVSRKLSDFVDSREIVKDIVDDTFKYMFRPINQHAVVFSYDELLQIASEAF